MIKEIFDQLLKEKISSSVLLDLPEWFGIPEYTKDYIEKSKDLVFFAAYDNDLPIGFVTLKETSQYTIEIHCMGILKSHHRLGYGGMLMDKVLKYAVSKCYKFIQVKTVEQGKYDTYDQTNMFYKSVGFFELEVFPKLWDEWNPCQVLVKAL